MEITMKNETVKNINTIAAVVLDTIGVIGCVSTVKKIYDQAMPQIKEAAGGKKVWFIIVTMLTEIIYLGFAIGTAIGAICAIKERIHERLSQNYMREVSEEDEDSSEDSKKIKRYVEAWTDIINENDDDQIVMPR